MANLNKGLIFPINDEIPERDNERACTPKARDPVVRSKRDVAIVRAPPVRDATAEDDPWMMACGQLQDYKSTSIKLRDAKVRKSLARLKKLPDSLFPGQEPIPRNLSQEHVARERRLYRRTVGALINFAGATGQLFFLTFVLPKDRYRLKRLTCEAIQNHRQGVSRRLRLLKGVHEYRAAGFVDISFNERNRKRRRWRLHSHIVLAVDRRCTAEELESILSVKRLGRRQLVVQRLKTEADVSRVCEYASSKLLADCQQRRVSYMSNKEKLSTKDCSLRPEQQDWLNSTVLDTGPERRWILSGLRRRGQFIVPELRPGEVSDASVSEPVRASGNPKRRLKRVMIFKGPGAQEREARWWKRHKRAAG